MISNSDKILQPIESPSFVPPSPTQRHLIRRQPYPLCWLSYFVSLRASAKLEWIYKDCNDVRSMFTRGCICMCLIKSACRVENIRNLIAISNAAVWDSSRASYIRSRWRLLLTIVAEFFNVYAYSNNLFINSFF